MNCALLLTCLFFLLTSSLRAECTTIIVTKGASADGSVMVSHSDDNDLMDQSIVHVPAKDWPDGSMRPVYPTAAADGDLPQFNCFTTPRLIAPERAPGYAKEGPSTIPLGFIPQVKHTYAYLDGNYGIVNEHGLLFGECTNGVLNDLKPGLGKNIMYSAELSRIALERCKTAREAIALMGSLVDEYGLYATGETLPVADADEAWVFEMAPAPDDYDRALWVAQRVPDGEVWVAANEFRIRDVHYDNSEYQMHSPYLFDYANKKLERGEGNRDVVDWLSLISHGEYGHPYYSLRRVWRVLSLAAPSLKLTPWVKDGLTREYPFSVKPDRRLTLADVQNIHRDHYEGTEFDLTKGLAAGPWGNPNRYLGPNDPSGDVGDPGVKLEGAWERALGMYYTGYTFVNQLRPEVPFPLNTVCWMALNTAAESVFVPLAVAPLPQSYENGDPRYFNWDSAWSVYNLIGEYSNIKYSYMIKDIAARASKHENASRELVRDLQKNLTGKARHDPAAAQQQFGAALSANAEKILADWRMFFGELVVKYRQGFINSPESMTNKVAYPQEWLDTTNYSKGPIQYEPFEK